MRAPQGRRISSIRQYRDRLSGGNSVPAGLIDEARVFQIGVLSTPGTKIRNADQRIEKTTELTGTKRVTGPKPRAQGLLADSNHFPHTPVRIEHFLAELLAEIHLRLVVVRVGLVLHDVEVEVVERSAHLVKPVLRFHKDLIEPVLNRPRFLLLGERAKMSLPAPVAPGATDPRI